MLPGEPTTLLNDTFTPFEKPRRRARLKQLNKYNRRMRRHHPESELLVLARRLEALEQR